MKKTDVGIVVMVIDLFTVVLLFALIAYFKSNQRQVSEDINDSELTASDFTVELRNLPELHISLEEQKAMLWEWIEVALASDYTPQNLFNQEGKIDENQNKLMNVTFGLNDVGRMQILIELAGLLKQEKSIN